jgi:hypothetical protein
MTTPQVSVLLPVYNAQDYLRESIDSILNQSFTDFELIIINDGSTDRSQEIIDSYTDPRIRLIDQDNAGLPVSLNRAIAIAKGQYLARQDADDVSLPNRLAEQVRFMEANPSCGLLGTWAQILEANAITDRELNHPCDNGEIQIKLMFYNCFVHSSVMIRKESLDVAGIYPEDPAKFPPEDYDLWLRIAQNFQVANLSKTLLQYRELPGSISRQKLDLMQARARLMSTHALDSLLNKAATVREIELLVDAMTIQAENFSSTQHKRFQSLLSEIAQIKVAQWPQYQMGIETGLRDCNIILNLAFNKSKLRQISRYLPFDLLSLIRKVRKI